jgi:hypothetical protein
LRYLLEQELAAQKSCAEVLFTGVRGIGILGS